MLYSIKNKNMRTIHLISHTHWDREWYLTFQEFRFKLIHLVDLLLDILKKNQNYKYFLLDGQAIILDDYLEIFPSRANEIIEYIKQGRINFGPWYISPDEFLINGEGHIRNLLEGDKISKISGGKMKIGYLPDTFGHIGQMHLILKKLVYGEVSMISHVSSLGKHLTVQVYSYLSCVNPIVTQRI
jgi:mannosylglycerate hydrolase